jgi:tRNA (guanine37-N1)-methyltransferase
MKIDIVTLFPEMYIGSFDHSIVKKAQDKKLIEINFHNLRNWGKGNYRQVDEKPFGGGAGMVLMIEPIHNCLKEIRTEKSRVIAMDAKGHTLKQSKVNSLSKLEHLIILAGHYEGFDHRILETLCDDVISIGNFVLSGGEIPSMLLVDAITRLLPGALGNEESPITDSFYDDDKSAQYPQYTRPEVFTFNDKQLKVPDVLLSGHHKNIEDWRKQNKSVTSSL